MATKVEYGKTLDVRYDVDVFVAGGGPAGIAAAVVAARQGRRVSLAETNGCLGGMGTAGLVPAFCTFGNGVDFLADGIGREVLESLNAEKGIDYPVPEVCIPAEMLKRVYDRMVSEAGVDFTFHTTAVDAVCHDGVIDYVVCSAKKGLFAVRAKIYIDATGDGDLSVMAGAKWEMGDETGGPMPGTLCSLWGNVEFNPGGKPGLTGKPVRELLYKCFEKEDIFTIKDPHHPGMWRVGLHVSGGNMGHAFGLDSTDERSLTHHLVQERSRMPEFEKFYRKYIPGYENVELSGTANVMGVRESRRIIGDYVLTADDFLARAVFEDEIGRYCYQIDCHPASTNPEAYAAFEKDFREKYRYKPGESYGIPYRCLTPIGCKNLLVAGRCVSTDRKMQASLRVMPGCYLTGQAAGMAASLAIGQGADVHGLNVRTLQEKLRGIGAFLPNFAG
ncbi:MAG: FAD-dependent oxidoreductase [Victivallaceae bacterium]|nr:FAD-dependent oxidoreductase [Victivallaceae bacterium]